MQILMTDAVLEYVTTRLADRIEDWGTTRSLQEATVRQSDDAYYVSALITDNEQEYGGIITDNFEITDDKVRSAVQELFDSVERHLNMNAIDVTHPHINLYPDSRTNVGITAEMTVPFPDGTQDDLENLLDSISPMIPNADSLSSIEAHLSSPTSETGWNDFTVHYETDSPHEEWVDCESVEDYCRMVAEHNKNVTFEEMMDKETYYGHTHLGEGKMDVVEWLREFGNQYVFDLFDTDEFGGRCFLSTVESDFDGDVTLSFVVAVHP